MAADRPAEEFPLDPEHAGGKDGVGDGLSPTGPVDNAQQAMQRLRRLDPALRPSNLNDRLPIHRPHDLARFADRLRLAGLPGDAGIAHTSSTPPRGWSSLD
jgi:hypothetical protein